MIAHPAMIEFAIGFWLFLASDVLEVVLLGLLNARENELFSEHDNFFFRSTQTPFDWSPRARFCDFIMHPLERDLVKMVGSKGLIGTGNSRR